MDLALDYQPKFDYSRWTNKTFVILVQVLAQWQDFWSRKRTERSTDATDKDFASAGRRRGINRTARFESVA